MNENLAYIKKLSKKWARCGVNRGDVLLVHSNIKRTLVEARSKGVQLTPDDILDSFLECLGSDGTLVLPLFNFDFAIKKRFDIRNTPSHMGALTEIARKRHGVVRTGHPIYSFAVLGKKSNLFDGLVNKSGYGEDSPFGLIHKLNGKIASLDLEDQNSMTFYHFVEESMEVDYRYFKKFKGEYIDQSGNLTNCEFKLFVRDLSKGVITHVNPAGDQMWELGLYSGDKPKEKSGLRTVEARQMYSFVANLIKSGSAEGNLFRYEK